MSAFICDMQTIDCIVTGMERYEVLSLAQDVMRGMVLIDSQKIKNAIGQKLLNENYRSVNYRYQESDIPPKYKWNELPHCTDGDILGCIDCYEYQACETDDYFETDVHLSIVNLKEKMLRTRIRRDGLEIHYGYKN